MAFSHSRGLRCFEGVVEGGSSLGLLPAVFSVLSVVAGLPNREIKVVNSCAVVGDLVLIWLVDDCDLRACLVVVNAVVGLFLALHLISSSISLLYSLFSTSKWSSEPMTLRFCLVRVSQSGHSSSSRL